MTDNALKTWYPKDHPKHLDPLHPALKLAGETGELIDLLAKGMFKPGFDVTAIGKDGLPKLDSELGDWSYYQRILAYLADKMNDSEPADLALLLVDLNLLVATFVHKLVAGGVFDTRLFEELTATYHKLLAELGLEYEDILQQNYWKLNEKDDTAHGWKNAR